MSQIRETPAESENVETSSPGRVLTRAILVGTIAAIILVFLSAPLAWFVPTVVAHWLLRTAFAFAVAWLLFEVVQRTAGMVGWPFSTLVVVLTLFVLASHHIIFAVCGIQTSRGLVSGWVWLTPACFLFLDGLPMIGLAGCVWLRHDGGADLDTLVDILRLRY